MSSYKITYFNGRGRAEISRLILAASGTQFEDKRVEDWPNGKEDAPLGQLPYLTVDDLKVPQSLSMARFLARRFNLAGKDETESVKADAVVDTLNDLQNAFYQKVFMVKTEEATKNFLAEDAVTHLGRVEKIVTNFGSNGFAVGSALTWADLSLFDITSILLNLDANVLNNYPRIQAIRKTVESNERVATWIKNRPVTPF